MKKTPTMTTKQMHQADPELREMVKLMEVEDQRDQMRKLEDERIAYATKMRQLGTMAAPKRLEVTSRGWMDKSR